MKKHFVLFLALLVFCSTKAAEPVVAPDGQLSFLFGIRAGFSASSTYLYRAKFNGCKLDEYKQDTQLGNLIMFHAQYGYGKIYLQSGAGISMNKSTFIVSPSESSAACGLNNDISFSSKMTNILVPLQIGYSFVNEGPYRLAVYGGPKARFLIKDRYDSRMSGFDGYQFMETPSNFTIGMTVGMSIQTGRTFFDLEYEIVMNNLSKEIELTGTQANGTTPMVLDRRLGIFSFSYGILF